jgi:hypothetical protein
MADTPADIKAATIAAIMGPEHGLYDRVSRAILAERAAQAERIRELEADARRYAWLRDGNAYAPEEQNVSGGAELDELCDEGIARSALGGNNG